MESNKHTPGPWTLGDENNECCQVILGDKHNLVASLDRQDQNTGKLVIGRDEMLANARLIAEAPYLIEVLERLHDEVDSHFLCCGESMSRPMQDAYNEAMELLSNLAGD